MRLSESRRDLSAPAGFKEGLLAVGLIPEKEREEGSQHRSPQLACQWLSAILKAPSAINHARERSPLEEWPDAHKTTLKEKLRPLVEIYEAL